MNMKQGLAMFGEDGVAAVKNEIFQLHERKVLIARNRKEFKKIRRRLLWRIWCFQKENVAEKLKAEDVRMDRNNGITWPKKTQYPQLLQLIQWCLLMLLMQGKIDKFQGLTFREHSCIPADDVVHVLVSGKKVYLIIEIDLVVYAPHVTIEANE
jgi:hypothetical protein